MQLPTNIGLLNLISKLVWYRTKNHKENVLYQLAMQSEIALYKISPVVVG